MEKIRDIWINGTPVTLTEAAKFIEFETPFDKLINVEVDTNKNTYRKNFESAEEAIEWLGSFFER